MYGFGLAAGLWSMGFDGGNMDSIVVGWLAGGSGSDDDDDNNLNWIL